MSDKRKPWSRKPPIRKVKPKRRETHKYHRLKKELLKPPPSEVDYPADAN